MHVISRKPLRLFWQQHPDSRAPLNRWFQIVPEPVLRTLRSFACAFPTADLVDRFTVFNIAGNKYRLITSIHFNRGKIYIRHVLTHAEYDQGAWKR